MIDLDIWDKLYKMVNLMEMLIIEFKLDDINREKLSELFVIEKYLIM